jgi:hypothetical protein
LSKNGDRGHKEAKKQPKPKSGNGKKVPQYLRDDTPPPVVGDLTLQMQRRRSRQARQEEPRHEPG